MTSTTNYQRRKDLGEVASMLFGTITVSHDEARRLHEFFDEKAQQYLLGDGYAILFRELLAVDPSSYHQKGSIHDILSTTNPGVGMEMTIRVSQGKTES